MPECPLAERERSNQDPGAERRLWFEYLAKLNDRQLQAQRASGITNWVLIAALIAVLHAAVSKTPDLLRYPEALKVTGAVSITALDAIILLVLGFVFLFSYSLGTNEIRLLSELERRARSILHWTMTSFYAPFVLGHFVLARTVSTPALVR